MDNLAATIEQLDFLYSISPASLIDTLDLRNKNLKSVPEHIWKRRSLTNLSLTNNHLSELPGQIGELFNLKELWLGGNALSSLPEQLGGLYQLQSLGIDRNNLSDLPSAINCLVHLEYLDLSRNKFTRFPNKIRNLVKLNYVNLAHNDIHIIPDFLANLPNLLIINIDGNPIINLESLNKIPNLCYAEFNGISLPSRYWKNLSDWKPEWILEEKDVELRQQLFDYFVNSLKFKISKSIGIEKGHDSSCHDRQDSKVPQIISDEQIVHKSVESILLQALPSQLSNSIELGMTEEIRGDPIDK
jgi:Leucine-rich repeat (LRR) protein